MKNYFSALILLFLAAISAKPAAQGLESMVFTVGTTIQDASGRDWAYLLWQGTDPQLVSGRSYALYAKSGEAHSPASYSRKAIVALQTDPLIIKSLLNRAIHLGENLTDLESAINGLFQKILPSGSLALEAKVSAVLRGASQQEETFDNLITLARLHPGISLCLGFAYADQIAPGAPTTFEIREFDIARNLDLVVLGRVTVQPGNPIVLPAPGAPVAVPDVSAKGDLNIKLRWALPVDLRRLSLLHYGFNAYRMTRAFAEKQGFHKTPPSPFNLRNLTRVNPQEVIRINQVPILGDQDFDETSVADFSEVTGDPSTFFLADDNRRFQPGGTPFVNGAQYYYFVTARDVLGRDGLVSSGGLATACDRMPPPSPQNVKVANNYSFTGGVSQQSLRVTWSQNDNSGTEKTTHYFVYRWDNPQQAYQFSGNPDLHRISPPLAHVPGQSENSFVDNGAGAPNLPGDAGKTYWYTVRALDDGACSGNLSGNSAPAFGVLRDRTGPDAPGGGISVFCGTPVVVYQEREAKNVDQASRDSSRLAYRLHCRRQDSSIQWAEFFIADPTQPANFLGRVYFTGSTNTVFLDTSSHLSLEEQKRLSFHCRVGASTAAVSAFASVDDPGLPKTNTVRWLFFESKTDYTRNPARNARYCGPHISRPPGLDIIAPIEGLVLLTPGAKAWKVYRRVDSGPLTLVAQGKGDYGQVSEISWKDTAMPPNAATLCYFGQLFDEHGNASPLAPLGECISIAPDPSQLPRPILSPLSRFGTDTDPQMTIRWFCPPEGIDRFEIWLARVPGQAPHHLLDTLSDNLAPATNIVFVPTNAPVEYQFAVYRTGRVGANFGDGALFTVRIPVPEGTTNLVFIKAVGLDGSIGEMSNVEKFTWSPPPPGSGPQVPWPARGLPPIDPTYVNGIQAQRLPENIFDGVGVRIGEVSLGDLKETIRTDLRAYATPGWQDPVMLLYRVPQPPGLSLLQIKTVLPFVLYRQQVANTNFPNIRGDTVQVSPLMEKIAWEKADHPTFGQIAIIRDPFIALYGSGYSQGIYMLDTQPVVQGARYRYYLVRFDTNGEIAQVIPTNEVEITP